MWLLASVNCLCLERASLWDFVVFAVVVFVYGVSSFFFFFSFYYWLESSVRGFRFFREVFVFFGVWIVFCPPEGSILSYLYNAWHPFLAVGGITVRVCRKAVVLPQQCAKTVDFCVFLAWDSISQPQGERDFAIYYTIGPVEMESRRGFFFLYINVATCER